MTLTRPASTSAIQSLGLNVPGAAYALALAGLSRQAADQGISSAEWIAHFSADAQDGRLNGTGIVIGLALPEARIQILTGLTPP
jgi:hypothetical protein